MPGGDINSAKHANYFGYLLRRGLSASHQSKDSIRMTVAYFCVSGLDLLGLLTDELKQAVIEWVYGLQKTPLDEGDCGGFRSSSFEITHFDGSSTGCRSQALCNYDNGHMAMTYTALCLLLICGDDLSRVHREGVLRLVKRLQQPDGRSRK